MNRLIWFRNDLRTIDNITLKHAVETKKRVYAVYFFDPRQYEETSFGFNKTGKFRAQFLLETVENLKKNLLSLNIPLFIYHNTPETILPELITEYKIGSIYLQKEWTSEEVSVRNKSKEAVSSNVKWFEFFDQFLFHPDDIPFNNFSEIPKVYTHFRKKCETHCDVRQAIDQPSPLSEENLIDTQTSLPSLHNLGLDTVNVDKRSAFPFKGGEDAAWDRLNDYFWKTENLKTYKHTRNGLIGTEYSSKLSAWLANGSISPRSIYWEVKKFENKIVKNQDTYWLIFELIWRDFFKYISLKHGNNIFKIDGILGKNYQWKNDVEKQKDWISGNTKYDFVNANMKEIAATGWMSNRGRQNVASFWAKELEQDWRIGASYFESMLIDYDVHSNWGNWMYNAGVGNDPRDRKFNIENQANRYDPNGSYIKLWQD